MAALLRRAQEQLSTESVLKRERLAAYREGVAAGKASVERERAHELQSARRSIAAFEAAAGVTLNAYNGGTLAEAYRMVAAGRIDYIQSRFQKAKEDALKIIEFADLALGAGEVKK